jgi:hypothetical protein
MRPEFVMAGERAAIKKPLMAQGFWRYLEVKSGFEPLYEVLQTSA